MKKLFLLLAVAAMSAQMNAQTVVESKNFDNWYIGVNGGANLQAKDFKEMNFQAGLRIGRWFTPVVGLAIEGQAFMGKKGGLEFIDKKYPQIPKNIRETKVLDEETEKLLIKAIEECKENKDK